MSYVYELKNLDEIVAKSSTSKEVKMKKDNISLYSQNYNVSDDVTIMKAKIQTAKDIKVKFKSVSHDFFSISCVFNGLMNFTHSNSEKTLYFDKQQTIISSPSTLNGYAKYPKNDNILSMEINLTDNFLKQNAPFLLEKTYKQKQIPKNQKIQSLAYEIYNSPFTGDLEKLYLQSKVYEFVYLNFLALNENSQKPKVSFSEFDKEALKKAKEILENSFDITPTIPELSKLVSLNEYKLKYGFKYFFNQTPHKILLSARLTKAKEMLLTGEYNVSEVAQKVGFKYVPTFSKAFVKVHGILPKDVRKRADIYI